MPVIFDDASFIDGGVIWGRVESREDLVMVSDDGSDELDHVWLMLDLVALTRHRHQRRTETDGQVVRIHHVLVAELRQAEVVQFQNSQVYV